MIKISDAFTLQMGKTPARVNEEYWNDGSNPWVSIADLSSYNKYVTGTKETITDLGVAKSGIKVVPANTVIMSFKLSLGKTAITTAPVYTNEAIMAFIPNGRYEVDTDYLYHLFSGRDWSKGTNRAVMGATLNKATLSEIEISLPPLAEQKHIADVLDKVNALINHRKEQLSELNELVKSRFAELFDDGESPIKTVEELCSAIVDCPHTTPKYEGELKNPAIRTTEIKKGYIAWETMRYVSDEEYEERTARLKPEMGDIVYGREGTFGNAAILPKGYNFCLGQRVMLLRPDYSKCTSEYLLYAVISDDVYRQAVGKNNASTVAHVNVKDVKQFKIPLPSFDKQNQFAAFVEQTDKSKLAVQNSIAELEELKKSLVQKYFG